MQEFDSVSVSSYEAASLAGKLNEKSADGWDVVAIVPTGSEVTAYLRRESTSSGDESSSDSSWTPTSRTSDNADTTGEVPSPGASEPAGWGSAPESTAATSSWGSTSGASSSDSGSSWASTGSSPSSSGDATSTWGTGATSTPSAPAAAPTPSVPAGWYSDPAGRFELRYWDGTAWTEHVARAGQQYTDPPVA